MPSSAPILRRPIFVYLAGPYTSRDGVNEEQNVGIAIDWAEKVRALGYTPIVPHFSHYWEMRHPHPYEFWMELDFELITRCDVLLRMPRPSSGADREIVEAGRLTVPVVHSIEELVQLYPLENHAQEQGADATG